MPDLPAVIPEEETPAPALSMRQFAYGFAAVVGVAYLSLALFDLVAPAPGRAFGEVVDSYQRVPVYYNGRVDRTGGRHLGPDGYNLGLKWQAAEFVKRFYLRAYGHRMPDTYGNPKDFFDPAVADGALNRRRGLLQFANPSPSGPPRPGDVLVFGAGLFNRNGHVAIVAQVLGAEVEIVQQNGGRDAASRVRYPLTQTPRGWRVGEDRVRGWLRLPG